MKSAPLSETKAGFSSSEKGREQRSEYTMSKWEKSNEITKGLRWYHKVAPTWDVSDLYVIKPVFSFDVEKQTGSKRWREETGVRVTKRQLVLFLSWFVFFRYVGGIVWSCSFPSVPGSNEHGGFLKADKWFITYLRILVTFNLRLFMLKGFFKNPQYP